jgi:hypothetical protein
MDSGPGQKAKNENSFCQNDPNFHKGDYNFYYNDEESNGKFSPPNNSNWEMQFDFN